MPLDDMTLRRSRQRRHGASHQATTATEGDVLSRMPKDVAAKLAAFNGGVLPTPEEFERIYRAFTYRVKCEKCQDAGRYLVSHEDAQGNRKRLEEVICDCQKEIIAERRWRSLQRVSDLTEQMRTMTFETFKRIREPDAFDAAQAYADDPNGADGAPPWLLLHGLPGNGKTHLLAAITHQLFNANPRRFGLYVMAPSMFDFIRQGYDDGDANERMERLKNVDVLLIDDLGAEAESPWQQEKLFTLLNHRYANELPSVFATNVPLSRMERRISSRLSDAKICEQRELTSQDYRATTARAKEQRPRRRKQVA